MKPILFKCLRCGRCCRNLINEEYGMGLDLTRKEVKKFPENMIVPGVGVGPRNGSAPVKIIRWQLNSNICPHLRDDKCTIYAKRPLNCRIFPLIAVWPLGTVIADPDICRFVENYEREHGSMEELDPLTPDIIIMRRAWPAIHKRNSRTKSDLTRAKRNDHEMWFYNIVTKKWSTEKPMVTRE